MDLPSITDGVYTQELSAWRVIDFWLRPTDDDSLFWWRATSPSLAALMFEAGYDLNHQYAGLLFYLRYVAPRLGPRPLPCNSPSKWKSFMTDDFSPLEFSWSWDVGDKPPKIRYAIEPIGSQAGSCHDPFNQAMAMDLIQQLDTEVPGNNWHWTNILRSTFIPDENKKISNVRSVPEYGNNNTSIMLAFEPNGNNIAIKTYFVPVKADILGTPRHQLLTEGIKALEEPNFQFQAYTKVRDFLLHPARALDITWVGLAVDCIAPRKSRLKLYVRSNKSSFDDVCSMITMNGALDSISQTDFDELRDIWSLVLSLPRDFPSHRELDCVPKGPSGVLYNYDLNTEKSDPEPKVYIPVHHYGKSDEHISQGLATYLRKQGRAQFVPGYFNALQRLRTHRSLDSGCGLHTYLSVSFKKSKLALTSYFSPEIYHPARSWSSKEV